MLEGLRWQKLFGRTDRFAVRFGLGVDDKRPSWGTIEIYVFGRCITMNEHSEIGSSPAFAWDVRDVIEFFATNWNEIVSAGTLPGLNLRVGSAAEWLGKAIDPPVAFTDTEFDEFSAKRIRFWHEHSLAAIGGIAIPDIVFRRVLGWMEVSWSLSAGVRRADIRWIEREGAERLPHAEVIDVLRLACIETANEIDSVASVVDVGAIKPNDLRQRLTKFAHPPAEPAPFTLAASGEAARLESTDVAALQALVKAADLRLDRGPQMAAGRLNPRPSPPPLKEPWTAGYELAREYRGSIIPQSDAPIIDLEAHLRSRGVDVGPINLSSSAIHGLSLSGPNFRPTIRWNTTSPRSGPRWSRQMTLAHELCHLLADWVPTEEFSILSGSSADWATEARANAFAAELVMPREGVVRFFGDQPVTAERLIQFMKEYSVGVLAATRHLKNLGRINEDERATLFGAVVGKSGLGATGSKE